MAGDAADPNFAVVYSFLERFGGYLNFQNPSIKQLEDFLNDPNVDEKNEIVLLHCRMLRGIGVFSGGGFELWEKYLKKFCKDFPDGDDQLILDYGYGCLGRTNKLRIFKNLCEDQFQFYDRFNRDVNKEDTDLRHPPLGTDRLGGNYWWFVDDENSMRLYRFYTDTTTGQETCDLVCSNADDLDAFLDSLINLKEKNQIDGVGESSTPNSDFKNDLKSVKDSKASPDRPTDIDAEAGKDSSSNADADTHTDDGTKDENDNKENDYYHDVIMCDDAAENSPHAASDRSKAAAHNKNPSKTLPATPEESKKQKHTHCSVKLERLSPKCIKGVCIGIEDSMLGKDSKFKLEKHRESDVKSKTDSKVKLDRNRNMKGQKDSKVKYHTHSKDATKPDHDSQENLDSDIETDTKTVTYIKTENDIKTDADKEPEDDIATESDIEDEHHIEDEDDIGDDYTLSDNDNKSMNDTQTEFGKLETKGLLFSDFIARIVSISDSSATHDTSKQLSPTPDDRKKHKLGSCSVKLKTLSPKVIKEVCSGMRTIADMWKYEEEKEEEVKPNVCTAASGKSTDIGCVTPVTLEEKKPNELESVAMIKHGSKQTNPLTKLSDKLDVDKSIEAVSVEYKHSRLCAVEVRRQKPRLKSLLVNPSKLKRQEKTNGLSTLSESKKHKHPQVNTVGKGDNLNHVKKVKTKNMTRKARDSETINIEIVSSDSETDAFDESAVTKNSDNMKHKVNVCISDSRNALSDRGDILNQGMLAKRAASCSIKPPVVPKVVQIPINSIKPACGRHISGILNKSPPSVENAAQISIVDSPANRQPKTGHKPRTENTVQLIRTDPPPNMPLYVNTSGGEKSKFENVVNINSSVQAKLSEMIQNRPAAVIQNAAPTVVSLVTNHVISPPQLQTADQENQMVPMGPLCSVCGDVANAEHNRVKCCLACKKYYTHTFSCSRLLVKKCRNSCIITKETRNNCHHCSIKKCLRVGMAGTPTVAQQRVEHLNEALEDYLEAQMDENTYESEKKVELSDMVLGIHDNYNNYRRLSSRVCWAQRCPNPYRAPDKQHAAADVIVRRDGRRKEEENDMKEGDVSPSLLGKNAIRINAIVLKQSRSDWDVEAVEPNSQPTEDQVVDKPCSVCQKHNDPQSMLLCDASSCEGAYHMTCLTPPIHVVPESDWFCPKCSHESLIRKLKRRLGKLRYNIKLQRAREKRNKIKKRNELQRTMFQVNGTNIIEETDDEDDVLSPLEKRRGQRSQKRVSYTMRRYDKILIDAINVDLEESSDDSSDASSKSSKSEQSDYEIKAKTKRKEKAQKVKNRRNKKRKRQSDDSVEEISEEEISTRIMRGRKPRPKGDEMRAQLSDEDTNNSVDVTDDETSDEDYIAKSKSARKARGSKTRPKENKKRKRQSDKETDNSVEEISDDEQSGEEEISKSRSTRTTQGRKTKPKGDKKRPQQSDEEINNSVVVSDDEQLSDEDDIVKSKSARMARGSKTRPKGDKKRSQQSDEEINNSVVVSDDEQLSDEDNIVKSKSARMARGSKTRPKGVQKRSQQSDEEINNSVVVSDDEQLSDEDNIVKSKSARMARGSKTRPKGVQKRSQQSDEEINNSVVVSDDEQLSDEDDIVKSKSARMARGSKTRPKGDKKRPQQSDEEINNSVVVGDDEQLSDEDYLVKSKSAQMARGSKTGPKGDKKRSQQSDEEINNSVVFSDDEQLSDEDNIVKSKSARMARGSKTGPEGDKKRSQLSDEEINNSVVVGDDKQLSDEDNIVKSKSARMAWGSKTGPKGDQKRSQLSDEEINNSVVVSDDEQLSDEDNIVKSKSARMARGSKTGPKGNKKRKRQSDEEMDDSVEEISDDEQSGEEEISKSKSKSTRTTWGKKTGPKGNKKRKLSDEEIDDSVEEICYDDEEKISKCKLGRTTGERITKPKGPSISSKKRKEQSDEEMDNSVEEISDGEQSRDKGIWKSKSTLGNKMKGRKMKEMKLKGNKKRKQHNVDKSRLTKLKSGRKTKSKDKTFRLRPRPNYKESESTDLDSDEDEIVKPPKSKPKKKQSAEYSKKNLFLKSRGKLMRPSDKEESESADVDSDEDEIEKPSKSKPQKKRAADDSKKSRSLKSCGKLTRPSYKDESELTDVDNDDNEIVKPPKSKPQKEQSADNCKKYRSLKSHGKLTRHSYREDSESTDVDSDEDEIVKQPKSKTTKKRAVDDGKKNDLLKSRGKLKKPSHKEDSESTDVDSDEDEILKQPKSKKKRAAVGSKKNRSLKPCGKLTSPSYKEESESTDVDSDDDEIVKPRKSKPQKKQSADDGKKNDLLKSCAELTKPSYKEDSESTDVDSDDEEIVKPPKSKTKKELPAGDYKKNILCVKLTREKSESTDVYCDDNEKPPKSKMKSATGDQKDMELLDSRDKLTRQRSESIDVDSDEDHNVKHRNSKLKMKRAVDDRNKCGLFKSCGKRSKQKSESTDVDSDEDHNVKHRNSKLKMKRAADDRNKYGLFKSCGERSKQKSESTDVDSDDDQSVKLNNKPTTDGRKTNGLLKSRGKYARQKTESVYVVSDEGDSDDDDQSVKPQKSKLNTKPTTDGRKTNGLLKTRGKYARQKTESVDVDSDEGDSDDDDQSVKPQKSKLNTKPTTDGRKTNGLLKTRGKYARQKTESVDVDSDEGDSDDDDQSVKPQKSKLNTKLTTDGRKTNGLLKSRGKYARQKTESVYVVSDEGDSDDDDQSVKPQKSKLITKPTTNGRKTDGLLKTRGKYARQKTESVYVDSDEGDSDDDDQSVKPQKSKLNTKPTPDGRKTNGLLKSRGKYVRKKTESVDVDSDEGDSDDDQSVKPQKSILNTKPTPDGRKTNGLLKSRGKYVRKKTESVDVDSDEGDSDDDDQSVKPQKSKLNTKPTPDGRKTNGLLKSRGKYVRKKTESVDVDSDEGDSDDDDQSVKPQKSKLNTKPTPDGRKTNGLLKSRGKYARKKTESVDVDSDEGDSDDDDQSVKPQKSKLNTKPTTDGRKTNGLLKSRGKYARQKIESVDVDSDKGDSSKQKSKSTDVDSDEDQIIKPPKSKPKLVTKKSGLLQPRGKRLRQDSTSSDNSGASKIKQIKFTLDNFFDGSDTDKDEDASDYQCSESEASEMDYDPACVEEVRREMDGSNFESGGGDENEDLAEIYVTRYGRSSNSNSARNKASLTGTRVRNQKK